jgi:hypothetical protein
MPAVLGGLINQQLGHISVFMLAAATGAELIVPPAFTRGSFAVDEHVTPWTPLPVDQLLDIPHITEYWQQRGIVVHPVRVLCVLQQNTCRSQCSLPHIAQYDLGASANPRCKLRCILMLTCVLSLCRLQNCHLRQIDKRRIGCTQAKTCGQSCELGCPLVAMMHETSMMWPMRCALQPSAMLRSGVPKTPALTYPMWLSTFQAGYLPSITPGAATL